MNSLSENHTWELTDLPVEAKAIPCKWVYRLKTNPDGSIDKYKASLVARGFSQRQSIDNSETYSPIAKLGTIPTVLSIAGEERMHLTQFDVSTAFLYKDLEETIFIQQPEGFKNGSGRVSKLKRSMYGLKQSPRWWNKCFGQFLTDIDDGLVAATDQQVSEMFIKELKTKFKISVGEVSCFLSFEIEHHKDNSTTVSRKEYTGKIFKCFEFEECKPVATPMLKDCKLQ
ncbi:retrovirus-related Pol polyprotein from transposon TNT 1-94 [Trichonephila inaurata madagascariensis]|uniref:Retrovirus-related Pol polyprotein from transposon TNT 1-94 n=1 Tax=Trichonephila inaurata madagascariensis TaxID=2747483 RepID=A0A8X6YUF7_9ARAC|nr:retrovirus-related Pol polyprotein from transposon TNT 1-94 [Trichonephila inaurata madagascariensis]